MSKGESKKVIKGLDLQKSFVLSAKHDSLDASLVSLFSSSSGPVLKPVKHLSQSNESRLLKSPSTHDERPTSTDLPVEEDDSEELSEASGVLLHNVADSADDQSSGREQITESRKAQKRKRDNEELEAEYMHKLAKDEAREQKHLSKRRQNLDSQRTIVVAADKANEKDIDGEDARLSPPPLHETLVSGRDTEIEKASRTVFLGNVSTDAIRSKADRRTLLKHLSSCFATDVDGKQQSLIESLRFRSTAFAAPIPKKAAFVRQELMDATTKSTNAYVVYTSEADALTAAKALNGTVVLGRHLRADALSSPAKIDHRRCVFVGNLGFVDDETNINAADDEYREKPRKATKPGDVEEGLWQQFSKAGKVESVRVVRDAKTRIGKGFAYVQFEDENGVEAALLFHDQKYPPLLPRKLRVSRAKKQQNQRSDNPNTQRISFSKQKRHSSKEPRATNPNSDQNLRRDVSRLLGKSDASKASNIPQKIVFEGHRASSNPAKAKQAINLLGKSTRSGKRSKPRPHTAKRTADWRKKSKTAEKNGAVKSKK